MTGMMFPYFTAATAVFVAVLQMVLLLTVARGRGAYQTGLGDGGHPGLLRRIRMHGNLAENAPLFLILLALVEASGRAPGVVPYYAAGFVIARLSHVVGLSIGSGANPFRFVGVIGTVIAIVGLAIVLGSMLAHDTHWLSALPHWHR